MVNFCGKKGSKMCGKKGSTFGINTLKNMWKWSFCTSRKNLARFSDFFFSREQLRSSGVVLVNLFFSRKGNNFGQVMSVSIFFQEVIIFLVNGSVLGSMMGTLDFCMYLFFNEQYQNVYGQYNGEKIQYHEKVNQKPTHKGGHVWTLY